MPWNLNLIHPLNQIFKSTMRAHKKKLVNTISPMLERKFEKPNTTKSDLLTLNVTTSYDIMMPQIRELWFAN